MSYKQIDEQVDSKVIKTMLEIGYGLLTDGKTFYKKGYELHPRENTTFSMTQAYEIVNAISQAKAEQREEDARIAERNKKKTGMPSMANPDYPYACGWNESRAEIATAIRQEGEK